MAIGTVFDHNDSQAVSIPAGVSLPEGVIKLRYASRVSSSSSLLYGILGTTFSSVVHASMKIFCPGERPHTNQRGFKRRQMKSS